MYGCLSGNPSAPLLTAVDGLCNAEINQLQLALHHLQQQRRQDGRLGLLQPQNPTQVLR